MEAAEALFGEGWGEEVGATSGGLDFSVIILLYVISSTGSKFGSF